MYFGQKTFIRLNDGETKVLKEMERQIWHFQTELEDHYEEKGKIEDKALNDCIECAKNLMDAYYSFADALQNYGDYK